MHSLLLTPITLKPFSAKKIAVGKPTYFNPIMQNFAFLLLIFLSISYVQIYIIQNKVYSDYFL
jgi:hypothetical protein